jgi:dienelactone hydrolase
MLPRRSYAQDVQSAYPGVAYRQYSRCLPDFLRALAKAAFERRNHALAALTDSKSIASRQRWARETFWKLAGGMPERTPLNARTLGSFERQGYRVEKIVYESRPKFYIPANLYVPTSGQPPFPGVLFQMGHALAGKAADTYQRCCQSLARLGYLVLAFDPMGQGERTYYPDDSITHTRFPSANDEHSVPGMQMLLTGFSTSTALQTWDAVRSLDYLAAHPLVDPKRIGGTGQSGGGTLTMFLACVDDRLATAVVCSGNTENVACAGYDPPGSTDDAEQNFVGSGAIGFDRWDVFYPFAPKPLLISVSDKDFFGTYSSQYIANGWSEFQRLKQVYEKLGHGERLAWVDTPLPHSLAYDSRLQIYRWFGRWLKGDDTPIPEEPAGALEPDRVLWLAESGNVVRTFGSLTPFTLNRDAAIERTPADLAGLLGVEKRDARANILRRVASRGIDIEALEIPSAAQVWVPAWLFLPRERGSKPVVIALETAGRNAHWHEGELYQTLAAQGIPVATADLRGLGDMQPEIGRGDPRYARPHADEENYAWGSLVLGKPLLGQRVTDLLAFAAALRTHPALSGRRIVLAAQGKLTVPALCAAALDPQISELYLAGGLVSFRSIVETEVYRHTFANFVPHLLRHTDLPDLAAQIAPRRVTLAGTVNAAGDTLDAAALRRVYGAARNVIARDQADWDVASLSAWAV